MKRTDRISLKFIAIGFASLVIAMPILRTLGHPDLAPGVAGAIMLSILVASAAERRQTGTPGA